MLLAKDLPGVFRLDRGVRQHCGPLGREQRTGLRHLRHQGHTIPSGRQGGVNGPPPPSGASGTQNIV